MELAEIAANACHAVGDENLSQVGPALQKIGDGDVYRGWGAIYGLQHTYNLTATAAFVVALPQIQRGRVEVRPRPWSLSCCLYPVSRGT